MRKVKLTSEWLLNWRPARREEVADAVCRGLVVRGGPSGAKTFYRWTDAKDLATGIVRRQRVKLGRWRWMAAVAPSRLAPLERSS